MGEFVARYLNCAQLLFALLRGWRRHSTIQVLRKTRFMPSSRILAQDAFDHGTIDIRIEPRQSRLGILDLARREFFSKRLQSGSKGTAIATVSGFSPYALAVRLKRRRVIRHSCYSSLGSMIRRLLESFRQKALQYNDLTHKSNGILALTCRIFEPKILSDMRMMHFEVSPAVDWSGGNLRRAHKTPFEVEPVLR